MLNGSGHPGVDDVPNVGAVDPHPEGHRGHDNIDTLVREGLLVLSAHFIAQARVVWHRAIPPAAEGLRELVHLGPADAVDDPRLPPVAVEGRQQLPKAVNPRLHPVDEVGPVETPDEEFGTFKVKLRRDIGAHLRSGGGRVGVNGHGGEGLLQQAELPVLRPEVVAPLADAVGLVHGEERHSHPPEQRQKAGEDDTLRGGVEQAEPSNGDPRLHAGALLGGHGAVEAHRGDSGLDQSIHLVLHQRDQRRHDHRELLLCRGRRLVAEGLPTAGREDHQRVSPGEDRVHGVFLQRQQAVVSPDPPDRLAEIGHRRPCCASIDFRNRQRPRPN